MSGEYSLYQNTEDDGNFKSYYEPIGLEKDASDMYIIITNDYHLKPGKMALALYGSPRFTWIFPMFNRDTIEDIVFDFTAGKIIRVPTKERVLSIY